MCRVWYKKCCCCIPLRIGAFILTYLMMVLTLLQFIMEVNIMIMTIQYYFGLHAIISTGLSLVHYGQMTMNTVIIVGIHMRIIRLLEIICHYYGIILFCHGGLLIANILYLSKYAHVTTIYIFGIIHASSIVYQAYTVFVVARYASELKKQAVGKNGSLLSDVNTRVVQNNVGSDETYQHLQNV